jgi:hypothetical protein
MEHFVIQRKVEHYRAMIKNATDLEELSPNLGDRLGQAAAV